MPRFALLEHHWIGLHWDFLLEPAAGGLLRTWAIDAPVVPGQVLPARSLGDHRPSYLDYEGEVPGNRGIVRRVDRGEYVAEVWTPGHVKVRLAGSQLVGLAELREAVAASGVSGSAWTFLFRLGNLD